MKRPRLAALIASGELEFNIGEMCLVKKDGGKMQLPPDLLAPQADSGEQSLVQSKDLMELLDRARIYEFEDSYFYTDQSSDSDDE